MPNLVPVTLK